MNTALREALQDAIQFEREGHDFFKEAAAKADNRLGREVFEFLAREEFKHIKAIEEFAEKESAGMKVDPQSIPGGPTSETPKYRELFVELGEKAEKTDTDLTVYELGMEFEAKGKAFYKKAAAEARDDAARKLFEFLVAEEERHFKILSECHTFFENPEEYFHRREGWHVEG